MVELRWVKKDKVKKLQYRTIIAGVDASGAFCAMSAVWSEWRNVPTITITKDKG